MERISKLQTPRLLVQRIKSELPTIRDQSFTPESTVQTILARQLSKSRDAKAPNYCRVETGNKHYMENDVPVRLLYRQPTTWPRSSANTTHEVLSAHQENNINQNIALIKHSPYVNLCFHIYIYPGKAGTYHNGTDTLQQREGLT
jgi:hypothetical protein